MFGLMRRAGRLPYCGTCKTLGSLYGQRARMLLNHDSVFLAELLIGLTGEPEWGPSYQSFNCLALPRGHEKIPVELEYAATATVLLGHFQIRDHKADSGRWVWNWAEKLISPAYRRAAARLKRWEFPLGALEKTLKTQGARELAAESLAHVAEPTCLATAMVFSHGAQVVGKAELASEMYRIGYRFGYLVYVLDAYEDRERDRKSGDFNPLLKLAGVDGRAEILSALGDLEAMLPSALAERLSRNVKEKLGLLLPIWHGPCRRTLRERWRAGVELGRAFRVKEPGGWLAGAMVVVSVAVIAVLFPHQAKSAQSWRQCMSAPMNLMAIGGVFSSMASSLPGSGRIMKPMKPGRAGGGGGGGGNWSCCDCLDGCDGCEFCCCDCGACDCAGCDCGGCDC